MIRLATLLTLALWFSIFGAASAHSLVLPDPVLWICDRVLVHRVMRALSCMGRVWLVPGIARTRAVHSKLLAGSSCDVCWTSVGGRETVRSRRSLDTKTSPKRLHITTADLLQTWMARLQRAVPGAVGTIEDFAIRGSLSWFGPDPHFVPKPWGRT